MTTNKPTLASIKAHNAEKGGYFFSRETSRFFRSKYYSTVYAGDGGVFFVHSSRFTTSDGISTTTYKVGEYDPATGEVDNVDSHSTLDGARDEAKRLAKG